MDTFSNIPGGARNLLPFGYERPVPNYMTETVKNREKQGFFAKNGIFWHFLHNPD